MYGRHSDFFDKPVIDRRNVFLELVDQFLDHMIAAREVAPGESKILGRKLHRTFKASEAGHGGDSLGDVLGDRRDAVGALE